MAKFCIDIKAFTKSDGSHVDAHKRCYEGRQFTPDERTKVNDFIKNIGFGTSKFNPVDTEPELKALTNITRNKEFETLKTEFQKLKDKITARGEAVEIGTDITSSLLGGLLDGSMVEYTDEVLAAIREEEGLTKSQLKTLLSDSGINPDNIIPVPEGNWGADTQSESFKRWSRGYEELPQSDVAYYAETGVPFYTKVHHGTTHAFYEFKQGDQGFLGGINYFTTSYNDAYRNYSHIGGADLAAKIQIESMNIANSVSGEFSLNEVMEETGISIEDLNEASIVGAGDEDFWQGQLDKLAQLESEMTEYRRSFFGKDIEGEEYEDYDKKVNSFYFEMEPIKESFAQAIAVKRHYGESDQVMDLFVRLDNPYVWGDDYWVENSIDFETIPEDDLKEAFELSKTTYDLPEHSVMENHTYEVSRVLMNNFGYESDVQRAMVNTLGEGIRGHSKYFDPEINLSINSGWNRDYGSMKDFYLELGFDSIILKRADNQFLGMDIDEGTAHIHIPDEHNDQIKLADGSNVQFTEGSNILDPKHKEVLEFKLFARNTQFEGQPVADVLKTSQGKQFYKEYLGEYNRRREFAEELDALGDLDQKVDRVTSLAKESGNEVDYKARQLAKKLHGVVSPINFKKPESIKRKVRDEYDGDITLLRDAVRNTIAIPVEEYERALDELKKDKSLKVKIQSPDRFLGYQGSISNFVTRNGLFAETQVVPDVIFAGKSPEDDSRIVLGDELYEKIKSAADAAGIELGRGHKIYEEIRVLQALKLRGEISPVNEEALERLKKESIEYYGKIRALRY